MNKRITSQLLTGSESQSIINFPLRKANSGKDQVSTRRSSIDPEGPNTVVLLQAASI
jgi:hypothetical protein